MRVRVLAAAGLGMLCAAGSASAQQRPDLSGTWVSTTDAPPADLVAAPSPVLGPRFALKQEGESLTVSRTGRDGTLATTFPAGGGESRYRVRTGLCRGDAEYTEAIAWDGATLTLTRTGMIPPGGGPLAKQGVALRLRHAAPDRLVVQGTMGPPDKKRQVGTVYRRTSDTMPEPPAGITVAKAPATIAAIEWISGTWVGTTEKGITVEERWTPGASGGMIGVARTLRGDQLSSFEFLCFQERDGSLIYAAMPNGRSPATEFALTAVSETSARFENPGHDFPKIITYTRRPDGSLETTISGEGGRGAQSFVLERKQ